MRNVWLPIAAVTLIIFAVVGFMLLSGPRRYDTNRARVRPSYSSVGESIYYAGIGVDSRNIPYTEGPHWMATMGERGCVSCHGIDGKGRFPLMMTSLIAPNVTYESLTSEEHYHGDQHEIHEGKYTDADIKRAIVEGLSPSGKRLNRIMPRWKMTEEELRELLAYLKNL